MSTDELHDAAMGQLHDDAAEVDGAETAVDDSPVSSGMGREVKVGLSVIGSLLMVLGGIIYVKMGMPGIKSKHVMSPPASESNQQAAAPTEEPPQMLAEPVRAPAYESAGAVDPFAPRAGADRYAQQAPPMTNEPSLPAPDGQAMPPANPAATPFGDPAAPPSEPQGLSGGVQPVAGIEPAPLTHHDLPPEPSAEGPLVPTNEPQLQSPHSDREPQLAEPQGVSPAAHEPTLAEPQNAPYGQRYTDDRYGTQHEPQHAPAPVHAPAEHLQPHAQEPHGAPAHNGAAPENHAGAPPPHHDLPYEHADLAQRPTRDGSYVVEPNDSFWTISQKVYGSPGFFKALQRHNRKPGAPNVGLSVGEKISTPPIETLRRDYPNLCPKPRTAATGGPTTYNASSRGAPHTGRVYVVEEGDTLYDIARYELGKASRWAEVYELNRDQLGVDYNHLSPGMRLAMPSDGANDSDNVTSRPATPYK
ncbi:MAG TPA: LysM peptidoglycan-binding domain-containing protein [Pirellulales bacterium]